VYKKETIRKEFDRSHVVKRIYPELKEAQDVIKQHHDSYLSKQVKRYQRPISQDVRDKMVETALAPLKEDDKSTYQSKQLDSSIVDANRTRKTGSGSYMREEERQKEA